MSWLEKLIHRVPKEALQEEKEKPKWVSPNCTIARHLPDDTKLLVVHPRSRKIFWLEVEGMVRKSGDVNIVGRKPGILNSKRISIAGNTKVKPVDRIKSFRTE